MRKIVFIVSKNLLSLTSLPSSLCHNCSMQEIFKMKNWKCFQKVNRLLHFLCLCHFSILPYQFHWKHSAAIRSIPAVITSTYAIKNDLWGDKPEVARDKAIPSILQEMKKLPCLIPSKAFWATSSAFIKPEEDAMILVSSGFFLFSAKNNLLVCSYTWITLQNT